MQARTASDCRPRSLRLGCDCLGEIHYFDAVVSDADGAPVTIPNAICMHEEDFGVLWRRIEWRTGEGEVRRSRRLVISSFAAIGNYDYGFFWYLYQDGTIAYEVKLTGVLSTGAVAPDERPRHGVLVAPGLNAMVHQHYFNVRLDLDIDGLDNTVDEVWTESVPPGPDNPHGNAFAAHRRPLWTEIEAPPARRSAPPRAGGRSSIPASPPARRAGRLSADSGRERRAVRAAGCGGDASEPASSTNICGSRRTSRAERYAAGEYPNQHPGGAGLPEWTAPGSADRQTATWSSGTRSAITTCRVRRTGR